MSQYLPWSLCKGWFLWTRSLGYGSIFCPPPFNLQLEVKISQLLCSCSWWGWESGMCLCQMGRGTSQPLGQVKAALPFLGHWSGGQGFLLSGRLKAEGPGVAARGEQRWASPALPGAGSPGQGSGTGLLFQSWAELLRPGRACVFLWIYTISVFVLHECVFACSPSSSGFPGRSHRSSAVPGAWAVTGLSGAGSSLRRERRDGLTARGMRHSWCQQPERFLQTWPWLDRALL